jgi:ATP-binding cassette subfamily B protein
MKLLFQYLKNYKLLIGITLLLAAINQSFSMCDPLILGRMIDKFANHPKDYTATEYLEGALFYIGLAIGAAMMSRIAKNFQDYFLSTINLKLGAQIYSDGLRHSLELPFQVFEDQRSGETLGILQKARTDVERLIQSFINIVFTSLVGIIFVIVVSMMVNPWIAPIYLISIPILGVVSSFLSKKIKTIQKKIVGETTALAGSTTESLRNIELVKSLGLANQEIKHLNDTTIKILGLELNKVKYIRSISFIQGTIVNLLRNTVLLAMMWFIFKGQLTPGQFLTFFIYSFFIFGPLQELGNIILIYRESEVSLNNLERIFNTPVEARPENPTPLNKVGQIKFSNVTFQHQSATHPAVADISFEVNSGETIAFVGPSGAGKTSLVKLLVGLYPPQNGNIYINDTDIHKLNLDEFREQIGFVTQDTQLFSGTIKENMLFVKPTATDEEINDALNKASCQSLLSRAEKGIDTQIGESGIKVSGGEKQRLSIARALLRTPNLMVFDEATSALDSITEEEISKTIREVSTISKHITVMIAHRLSTIMHADRIYVLEKGNIIEVGKHDELLEEKGLYYALWRQQIGERKSDRVVAKGAGR